jgi:hypothetical protein
MMATCSGVRVARGSRPTTTATRASSPLVALAATPLAARASRVSGLRCTTPARSAQRRSGARSAVVVRAQSAIDGYCSTTLTTWLLRKEREGEIDNELTVVLSSIATACKQISSLVQRAGISNMTGLAGETNVQVRSLETHRRRPLEHYPSGVARRGRRGRCSGCDIVLRTVRCVRWPWSAHPSASEQRGCSRLVASVGLCCWLLDDRHNGHPQPHTSDGNLKQPLQVLVAVGSRADGGLEGSAAGGCAGGGPEEAGRHLERGFLSEPEAQRPHGRHRVRGGGHARRGGGDVQVCVLSLCVVTGVCECAPRGSLNTMPRVQLVLTAPQAQHKPTTPSRRHRCVDTTSSRLCGQSNTHA